MCKKAQNSERGFRIARAEHGESPHESQRHRSAFGRMWVNIRHAVRPRSLEENDRAMRASRERCGLREQTPVCKRDGEIRIRLPLDDNATVKAIIADGQVLHADVELVALAHEIDQCGVPF